jgi:threonine/homoserine/homoserine lactone efflux protein
VGNAIGQVLSFGVGVAISPVPIIAVVLMLGTPRARGNGPAFLLGWLVGLAVAGVVVLLVAGGAGADDDGGSPTWLGVLKLVLGTLLLALALKQWRGRPADGAQGELPTWMAAIDTFTPVKALGIGVVLSAANPKNLLLTIGAAAAIAQTGASTGSEVVALAVFVVIGTLGVGAPIAVYFAMGDRAVKLLDELKTWMGSHNGAIMAVLFLVMGAKLLGDGVSTLS